MATLFIFAGLPGTGKTTLSQLLAMRLGAAYLRIDTVEQALRDLCHFSVEGEGYGLSYRIAADNLRLGNDVVADSCNPIELTRREWEHIAIDNAADFINIEVVCSDRREHQRRVEARSSSVPGLRLPTWREVVEREYHSWSQQRIIIDTAVRSTEECLAALLVELGAARETD